MHHTVDFFKLDTHLNFLVEKNYKALTKLTFLDIWLSKQSRRFIKFYFNQFMSSKFLIFSKTYFL